MTDQTEAAEGTIDGVPFTYEQARIVAAREAAAEARGAARVLAAVEAFCDEYAAWYATNRPRLTIDEVRAAARAAATGGGS